MLQRRTPTALSIAGSDSGGGAGIQADLKAFARCGVHGTTAITAITAQNTVGVEAVESISPRLVIAQVRAVAEDIGVNAVKIGMLGTAETVEAVVEGLMYVEKAPVVIDPVMIAESGAVLLDEEARMALAAEARALTDLGEGASQAELAEALVEMGATAAVVTGGHSEAVVDVFYDGVEIVEIHGERYPDGAAHGSGCTHSSSLAAYLALGRKPLAAAEGAREITSLAVRDGLREIGAGAGPVDVFGLAGGELTSL